MTRVRAITVREAHGIRRFLYPLRALIPLPKACSAKDLRLQREDGRPVPSQAILAAEEGPCLVRLDFAVSLDPFEELKLELVTGAAEERIDDPLIIESAERYRCVQKRFSVEFDLMGCVHQAVYDGAPHLRGPSGILRNGQPAALAGQTGFSAGPLAARISALGRYPDACSCRTVLELSACKSWAALTHVVATPRAGDEVSFSMPFAVGSTAPTCDFGIGGGLYGKLQEGSAPEVTWLTNFDASGQVRWSLATGDRVDYQGHVPERAQYRSQRWFHLVDRDKALAATITEIPADCRSMTVSLRASGDTDISFRLGDVAAGAASFGICYHFLNDIPARSAATNPQSILLPPIVDAR